MMKRKWMLAGAVMLLAAALAAGLLGSRAAPAPGYLLRYAENQPDDYPTTQSAYYFADLVSERTGGDVKITVYANGTLGDESSVIRQVQFGGIDLARVSIAQLVVHAEIMSVLTMPYLYRDNAHMWSVLEGSTGDRFLAEIAPAGLIGLSWYDAGERHFYTRTPITGLDDLRGMTIRVQEADYMSDMVRAGIGAVRAAALGRTRAGIPAEMPVARRYGNRAERRGARTVPGRMPADLRKIRRRLP